MQMLVARTPGPSAGQGNHPHTPREATIIPIVLGVIAVLVLAGLTYSRYHDAIIVTPVLRHIDCLEKPTMWEAHIASGCGGSAAVGPGPISRSQRESATRLSWSEIMVRRTPYPVCYATRSSPTLWALFFGRSSLCPCRGTPTRNPVAASIFSRHHPWH